MKKISHKEGTKANPLGFVPPLPSTTSCTMDGHNKVGVCVFVGRGG